jgi:hypothetical protein
MMLRRPLRAAALRDATNAKAANRLRSVAAAAAPAIRPNWRSRSIL